MPQCHCVWTERWSACAKMRRCRYISRTTSSPPSMPCWNRQDSSRRMPADCAEHMGLPLLLGGWTGVGCGLCIARWGLTRKLWVGGCITWSQPIANNFNGFRIWFLGISLFWHFFQVFPAQMLSCLPSRAVCRVFRVAPSVVSSESRSLYRRRRSCHAVAAVRRLTLARCSRRPAAILRSRCRSAGRSHRRTARAVDARRWPDGDAPRSPSVVAVSPSFKSHSPPHSSVDN
jgi:hypothetical protein